MEHKKQPKPNPFEKFYKKSPRSAGYADESRSDHPKSRGNARRKVPGQPGMSDSAEPAPRAFRGGREFDAGFQNGRGGRRSNAPLPMQSARQKRGDMDNRGPRTEASPASNLRINFVYEDQDIIAVEKPAGLPVIAPGSSRTRNALDLVSKHIQIKNPKGRAALVHRLDRDTSGIMIFAKNAKTKAILMKNWDRLVTRRCYTALVEGRLPQQDGVIVSWLQEQSASRVREVPKGTHGALRAVTHYRVLSAKGAHSLVELELETGRRHQIRVQLAGLGHPIAGDRTYGATTDPAGRLCLHANLLVLTHPHTGKEIVLESKAPAWVSAKR